MKLLAFVQLAALPMAAASGQTVEGAHSFLKATLPGLTYYDFGKDQGGKGNFLRAYVTRGPCEAILATDLEGHNGSFINYDALVSATASGPGVHIQHKGKTFTGYLLTGGEPLSQRVAFALEFLRVKCDPAADTGF